MTVSVELEASVTLTVDQLRLDYQIINGTDTDIYAYVLPTDGSLKPFPHQAYACLSKDKTAIYLLLGETPPPSGISLNVRAQPLAVFIPKNGRYENSLKLELPLLEWNAYDNGTYPNDNEVVTVSNVDLVITYVNQNQTFFVDRAGEKDYFQVGGYPVEKLKTTLKPEQPVSVRVRPDDFERFPI